MSRAAAVWITFDDQGTIKAAFTVRHELVTWLNQQQEDVRGWRVYRVPDGFHRTLDGEHSRKGPVEPLDIMELLAC